MLCPFREAGCKVLRECLSALKQLERALEANDALLGRLKPRFVLVGSIPEGTRIGLPNEMDVMVTFDGAQCVFPLE